MYVAGPFSGNTWAEAHRAAEEWLHKTGRYNRSFYTVITYEQPGIGGYASKIETTI